MIPIISRSNLDDSRRVGCGGGMWAQPWEMNST